MLDTQLLVSDGWMAATAVIILVSKGLAVWASVVQP